MKNTYVQYLNLLFSTLTINVDQSHKSKFLYPSNVKTIIPPSFVIDSGNVLFFISISILPSA